MIEFSVSKRRFFSLILSLVFVLGTFYVSQAQEKDSLTAVTTVYLISNTAKSAQPASQMLETIKVISKEDVAPYLLFLGNYTPEKVNSSEAFLNKNILEKRFLEALDSFGGKLLFIPGENEWASGNAENLDKLQAFLQQTLSSNVNSKVQCPLQEVELGAQAVLISLDSQWFLEDWDKKAKYNVNCSVQDQESFFLEIKTKLQDNYGKTKIIAVHHPILSNSRPGVVNRLFPFSRQNYENKQYKAFRKRLETLASQFENVIFVSGHDQNLQYIQNDRVAQIISSATGGTSAKIVGDDDFASETPGFAKLSIFKNGKSLVEFYKAASEDNKPLFSKWIDSEKIAVQELEEKFPSEYPENFSAAIYTSEETKKGGFHKFLWGAHYRDIYSTKVELPVLLLDSLGTQLELLNKADNRELSSLRYGANTTEEFQLQSMRQNPIPYLQAKLLTDSYVGDLLNNTIAERWIRDFFTTSHPYARLAVNNFSDALQIPHLKPSLFYVPKQRGLNNLNEKFGDRIYELEVGHPDKIENYKAFDNPTAVISTHELLRELHKHKNSYVDETAYVKARLLDMLIGDWDRGQEQWLWAAYDEGGKTRYAPIPRNRQQAFSKYDGFAIAALKLAVPEFRKMQTYDANIKNVKWFNYSAYPLDLQVLYKTDWSIWEEQVKNLQNVLSDAEIEAAFAELPSEAQDESIEDLKEKLKARKQNLPRIAEKYYKQLAEFVIITGTHTDDSFNIARQADGNTRITQLTEGEEVFQKEYSLDNTKEIWIYGLSGKDKFTVTGDGKKVIKINILGGPEADTYDFKNRRRVKLYDFKNSKNEIIESGSRKLLSTSHNINTYQVRKFKFSEFKVLPYLDFETDAGFTVGAEGVWTKYGLINKPFQAQHRLLANYYLETNGIALTYEGEFARLFNNWNLTLNARYTSPNYAFNYFGSGTLALYDRENVSKKYNTVKLQKWHFSPGIVWRNQSGSRVDIKAMAESYKVKYEPETYVGEKISPENDIFDAQLYAGGEVVYNFNSKNSSAYPNLGSEINIRGGYKAGLSGNPNKFGYVEPSLSMVYPLIPSGFAVIATKLGGEVILGDQYEFYHAANIGGNESLRGYRTHRFNGKQSFYHSTDLRSALGLWENKLVPIVYGVTLGFDYGRVWTPGENSEKWHNNYGGSLWVSAGLAISGAAGYYYGDDGGRLALTLNFKY